MDVEGVLLAPGPTRYLVGADGYAHVLRLLADDPEASRALCGATGRARRAASDRDPCPDCEDLLEGKTPPDSAHRRMWETRRRTFGATGTRRTSGGRPVTEKLVEELADEAERGYEPEKLKDPDAVSLGRRGGLKGGPARAASLTPGQRQESARKAARARWHRD